MPPVIIDGFAVADLQSLRFSGLVAWILWLGVHIYFLIGFANRLLVMLQWSFSFWTKRRGVRIFPRDPTTAGIRPAQNRSFKAN